MKVPAKEDAKAAPEIIYTTSTSHIACYFPHTNTIEISSHLKQFKELHDFALAHELKHAKSKELSFDKFKDDFIDRFKLYNDKTLYKQLREYKKTNPHNPRSAKEFSYYLIYLFFGLFVTSWLEVIAIKHYLNKTRVILLGLIVITFFIRAYPHFVVYQFLACEEENLYRLVDDLIVLGSQRMNSSYYDPLTPYAVYGLYLLTGVDPIFLSQYFNPTIGAITVVAIYLLSKQFLSTKESLYVATLFAFSEVALARLSSFGSGEPLGFLLAVFTLILYLRNSYVLTMPMLGVVFFAHILPFAWLICIIFLDAVLFGKLLKKIMSLGLLAGAIFCFIAFNMRGATSAFMSPSHYIHTISLANILSLYSLNDLITVGLRMFLGTATLGVVFIMYILKTRKIYRRTLPLFLAATIMLVGMWVGTETELYSPVRMLLYITIPLSFYVSRFVATLKRLHAAILTIVITATMLLSYPGVATENLWIQDSLTKEEYLALDDLRLLTINYNEWWSDYPVHMALMRYSSKNVSYPVMTAPSTPTDIHDIMNLSKSYRAKYIFLSARMEDNALFIAPKGLNNIRTTKIHLRVEDIWQNSSRWKIIYDKYGVKVYERIY